MAELDPATLGARADAMIRRLAHLKLSDLKAATKVIESTLRELPGAK